MNLDEVLWENETRRTWWQTWLKDLESTTHATDNYRNFFTGLDTLEPDPEAELRCMLDYLHDLLRNEGLQQ